jgi:tetratricopeptide (TPR) repeat protein
MPEQQQTLTIQQAIDLAVQHHNAGRLSEAESIYQQILETNPNQHVALHLLGVIAHQVGKNDIAVDLITKALAIKPGYADAHFNLGLALKELERLDEAVANYQMAIAIKPDYPEAYNNLGTVLIELGRLDEAVARYQKALHFKPDFAEAHCNLGNALQDLGELKEAVSSYYKALSSKPDYAEAHYSLGLALKELGRLDEAVANYQMAIAIKPDYPEAYNNLGNTLYELGWLDEAIVNYLKALANKPDFAGVWNNLKFATRALEFSKGDSDRAGDAVANGLNNTARATVSYAIHQFYQVGFSPHEADESFENVIAALPAKAGQAIPINGAGHSKMRDSLLPDKVVALLHFGRSGTGLLHSLIDSHPEITTLPSVYLRGYFNEGVWDKLSADGWRELPGRFADTFAVLFDARSSKPIPSRLDEPSSFIGKSEGMTSVGENSNEYLSLDRAMFCVAALRLMEGMESIDPMSFLMVVHAAFEDVTGPTGSPGTKKRVCFYHIHNPDDYAQPNFLRYAPDARLLMTVREPVQNCESTLRASFKENDYDKGVHRMLEMLFAIDQIAFRLRESVGIRLEDLKARPEATMQSLCAWLGVEEFPSLYEMTAQGKKWWGDPTSPDYAKGKAMSPFDDTATKRTVGTILGEKDQFVLQTLFYPFSVRFGYREPDPGQFQKDLKEIRPLLDDMLDFEKTIAKRSNIDPALFKRSGSYQLLRAGLVDRWQVLDEIGDYPFILEPLPIP